jgi:hypothetical protein
LRGGDDGGDLDLSGHILRARAMRNDRNRRDAQHQRCLYQRELSNTHDKTSPDRNDLQKVHVFIALSEKLGQRIASKTNLN